MTTSIPQALGGPHEVDTGDSSQVNRPVTPLWFGHRAYRFGTLVDCINPFFAQPRSSLTSTPYTLSVLLSVLLSLLVTLFSSSATVAQPFGVQLISGYGALQQTAADSAGFIYAAHQQDMINPTPGVVKLAADGTRVQYFNTSGSVYTSAPYGVAVDGSGAVYVSSYGVVVKLSPVGDVLQTYSFPSNSRRTYGIALDSAGYLYVCFATSIVKYNSTASAVQTFSTNGPGQPDLQYPTSVVVDGRTNDVFVIDSANVRLVKFASNGSVLATAPYNASQAYQGQCFGLTMDPRDGTLVVGCNPVQRYTVDLTIVESYSSTVSVVGVAVSPAGVIYLTVNTASAGAPSMIALHFERCPASYYCNTSVESAVLCPVGYYCPANQTAYGPQVLPCPSGSCCTTSGLLQPSTCTSSSSSSSSSFIPTISTTSASLSSSFSVSPVYSSGGSTGLVTSAASGHYVELSMIVIALLVQYVGFVLWN